MNKTLIAMAVAGVMAAPMAAQADATVYGKIHVSLDMMDYDITTNTVTISTIHSVKGLDYSVVFLLGLDFLEPKGWSEEQLARLVYVATTRARYQLFIPYINQSELIQKLEAAI